jgi:hypothetical protein
MRLSCQGSHRFEAIVVCFDADHAIVGMVNGYLGDLEWVPVLDEWLVGEEGSLFPVLTEYHLFN